MQPMPITHKKGGRGGGIETSIKNIQIVFTNSIIK